MEADAGLAVLGDERLQRVVAEGPRATPLIELPGATFTMGSDLSKDEQPVRQVTVYPFAVAVAPVTNAEYAHFLEATGHESSGYWHDPRFSNRAAPVIGVSWFDAVAYCEWLGDLLGRHCRLPTEAEREYAARGGVPDVLFPWGDEPWSTGVHALGTEGGDRPHPVGSTPPNGFGLYHMADNVHEWCSDWHGRYPPPDETPVVDPRGAEEGIRRASRGGSWRHRVKVTRIAARSSLAPERRYNDYGMRVYADVAPPH